MRFSVGGGEAGAEWGASCRSGEPGVRLPPAGIRLTAPPSPGNCFKLLKLFHLVSDTPQPHTAGFADWLDLQLARAAQGLLPAAPLLLPGEAAALLPAAAGHVPTGRGDTEEQHAAAVLRWALDEDAWLHSSRVEAALKAPLLRLAAHYLLRERRRCGGSYRVGQSAIGCGHGWCSQGSVRNLSAPAPHCPSPVKFRLPSCRHQQPA